MNERGKSVDKTHLSIDTAEVRGFIHRDYIAHCLRWSHVMKFLGKGHYYKYANILDIGCGKEIPLAKTMYSSKFVPTEGKYTGIDVNRLEVPEMFRSGKFPIRLIGNHDVCEYDFGQERFNVITCFEVLEHVEPAHSLRILERIKDLMTETEPAVAFISTPIYDPDMGAAANHVNEMSLEALAFLIDEAGLIVEAVHGTFASQRDIEPRLMKCGSDVMAIYQRLKAYYDTNYLATIFAPLFPRDSRNALWKLRNPKSVQMLGLDLHNTQSLWKAESLTHPDHSSSKEWQKFASTFNFEQGE